MAIIIDTNCLANVFVRTSAKHNDFEPVLTWIIKGKGIIIYGGSKYQKELKKTPKFLPILRLLNDLGKVYKGDSYNIDKLQKSISKAIKDPDFDDQLLPAIVIDTKCKIICSEDKKSTKFVKRKTLYPKGFTPPVYYMSKKNQNLLTEQNIDDRLKPYCVLRKEEQSKIENTLK